MLEDHAIDALSERDIPNGTNEVQVERARAVAVTQRVEPNGRRNDTTANSGSITALLPIMGVVLVAFLVIGIALPVLPLHVHQGLALGTFVVGLVTGSQFAASLISRMWSGHYADSKGAKRAVVVGLLTAVAGGLLYLLSLAFLATPPLSAAILLGGRALLGVAESFVITGGVSWGLAVAGPANTGRVIAWVGMAMFAALAVGAPIGTALYALGGFTAVALATIVSPLATVLLVIPLRSVAAHRGSQSGLLKVLGSVWLPGFGSALSTMGFGEFAAVRSTWLEPGLPLLQCFRDRSGRGTALPRSYTRQTGRRDGSARFRLRRSDWSRIDLVCVNGNSGGGRRRAHRLWLRTGLPGTRR